MAPEMNQPPITVVAVVRAKKGCETALKNVLLELLAPSRAEESCIRYWLHQHSQDPTRFIFYETWTSLDALKEHSQAPHLEAFRAKASALLAGPIDLTIWDEIGSERP